jgi:hypothetical protein
VYAVQNYSNGHVESGWLTESSDLTSNIADADVFELEDIDLSVLDYSGCRLVEARVERVDPQNYYVASRARCMVVSAATPELARREFLREAQARNLKLEVKVCRLATDEEYELHHEWNKEW